MGFVTQTCLSTREEAYYESQHNESYARGIYTVHIRRFPHLYQGFELHSARNTGSVAQQLLFAKELNLITIRSGTGNSNQRCTINEEASSAQEPVVTQGRMIAESVFTGGGSRLTGRSLKPLAKSMFKMRNLNSHHLWTFFIFSNFQVLLFAKLIPVIYTYRP